MHFIMWKSTKKMPLFLLSLLLLKKTSNMFFSLHDSGSAFIMNLNQAVSTILKKHFTLK